MKKRFISSFVEAKFLIARCLTLLILALLSTNYAWGKEGDVLAEVQGTGSSYGRQTTTDSYNVGWITIGQSGYLGINSPKNNTGAKAGVNATDLPVAQAVNASATSSTSTESNSCTGYYTFYTTTALKNVGSIEFYYSANSGNSDATAYVVMGDAKSASGGAAYVQVPLATSSTSKQGVSLGTSGTFTFTFAETQKDAKYYGVVIATSSYKRMTGGKITIKEGAGDTPAAELVSIAISGTPDKTTYETGESFDPAGLVVTGTYTEGDPEEITSGIDWTITPNPLTAGTTSVSVTATVDGKSDTKNYNVTVTEHVITPGTFDIVPSFTFFGLEEAHTSGSHDDVTGKQNDITVVYSKGTQSYFYTNATQCRLYNGSTLTFSVPQGYEMTAIAFTADGNNWGETHTASVGTMTDSKNWSGSANSVTITFGGTCRCTKITVTYEAKKTLESIAIKTAPKATYNAKETFDPTGMVITATYDVGEPKEITYDANDDKWSFSPNLETLLKGTYNKVIITYGGKTAEQAITVTRLSAGLAVASETKDVVVDAILNISEWYSVADGYDGTISVVSNNKDVFDVEDATGLAYAAGTATLTITTPQTDYYAEDSKTIVVTVSAEAVHYTVTWINKGAEYTEGNPTTDVIAGQKVETLPTAPTAIEGTAFMGWTAIKTITDGEAPTDLFKTAEDAPTVDADVIYRAVYAQERVGEPIKGFILSNDAPANGDKVLIAGKNENTYYALTSTIGTSALTISNDIVTNEDVADYTWTAFTASQSDYTGIGFKVGTGNPLHINSTSIRTANGNQNGTFEFTADATNGGFQMKSNQNERWLKFTNTPSFTSSDKAVGGIYFFKETELPGEKIYTNYSFTNVAPIKDITVTPSVEEAETYWDAFTVTLDCETSDVEIRYTLDGTDPKESETVYSSAINISGSNETITLRAIATDGNDNWSKEVTKEYTFGPIFSSLEDLAAADLESETTVKVSFENVPIKSIFVTQQGYRNGIFFDIQKDGNDIEIYYQNVPETWVAGGKVSGTMICPWTEYNGTWELAPKNKTWSWSNLTYVAPTTVTIASSGYSSFSSTYAVTIPEGITAYYATGVEGNKVSMIEVEGEVIPANEGVIIKGEALQSYTFIETVSDETFNGNKLVAVSERIENLDPEVTIEDVVYKNYVFTGGQFHPFTSGATVSVGAGKAYLQVEKTSDTNAKLEMSFGDVTGIESLIPTLSKGKGVYNLQGVRVSENYKGIIIMNGKKYINK